MWHRSPAPAGSSIPPPRLCPGSGTAGPGCSAAWPRLDETCPGPGTRGASGWARGRPRGPQPTWPALPCLLPPSPGSPVPACTEAQPPCTCPACHTGPPDYSVLQPPRGGRTEALHLGPAGTWELQGGGEEASLTAGWSLPRVFSRMARASLSRWAASLYLFWSLGAGAS